MMGLNGSYLLEELEEKSKRSHELDFYVLHAVIRFSLAVLTEEILRKIRNERYSFFVNNAIIFQNIGFSRMESTPNFLFTML